MLHRAVNEEEVTVVTTTINKTGQDLSGTYYHACGVDYTREKQGTLTAITDYLFLPFTLNFIGIALYYWITTDHFQHLLNR